MGAGMFALWRLRRRCESRLADLPLPEESFTIEGLVKRIEEERGRKIQLVPIEGCDDMRTACGLRARTRECTYILYRPRPTPNQNVHVLLHELCHEWFGHSTTLTKQELEHLIPGSLHEALRGYGDDAVIQARARYGTVEEREAELGAYVIERLVARRPSTGDDLVSRLSQALSHPVAPPLNNRVQQRNPSCPLPTSSSTPQQPS
ncbi:hypothetical protein ACFU99_01435 [Streptomyces sp. NPDC057654]|uniref:hypothetical protein n=1 Tax=Streptomyces sp. NPDC057654 TaxID=3346196 RepID=UPI0036A19BB6